MALTKNHDAKAKQIHKKSCKKFPYYNIIVKSNILYYTILYTENVWRKYKQRRTMLCIDNRSVILMTAKKRFLFFCLFCATIVFSLFSSPHFCCSSVNLLPKKLFSFSLIYTISSIRSTNKQKSLMPKCCCY